MSQAHSMATVTTVVPTTPIVNRMKRAQGQLAGILKMIEEERDLEAVLTQIKAVSSALERTGFALVASEWRQQTSENHELTPDEMERFERLFLSLG